MTRSPRRQPFISKREFCDEINMPDMNTCDEVIKYMSLSDLYRYFGIIPTNDEILKIQNTNRDDFLEILELLLSDGIDIDIDVTDFNNPSDIFLGAVEHDYINIVQELLEHIRYGVIGKALIIAARNGYMDIAQIIAQAMIRSGHITNEFENAMRYAAFSGHMDIVQEMIRLGANNFDLALDYAVRGGHMNIVQEIIRRGGKGIDVNDFNKAMILAAHRGHIDIVQEMIRLGATNFDMAMEFAASGGHMDIVQELLRHKRLTNRKRSADQLQ
jgi:hypothetical protein